MDELATFTQGMEESEELEELLEDSPGEIEGKGKKQKGKKRSSKKKESKEPKPKRDNIARVQSMNSISGVRKFLQIAIAKKAKSVGREDAIARYDKEIEAAKTRLNELIDLVNEDENPIEKLIKLDEEPNKVITFYIKQKEADFDEWVDDLNEKGIKVAKSVIKKVSNEIPDEFFKDLGPDLVDDLKKRHEKVDFRLRAICQRFNFKKMYENEEIYYKDGKWFGIEAFEKEDSEDEAE